MTTMNDVAAPRPVLPAPRHSSIRLHLLGRSTIVMLTSMTGVALFAVWITLVAVSPITIVAPLVLPATAAVRAYANLHRRSAARLLGRPIHAHYRTSARPGFVARIWTIERDPASWRDTAWLLLHAIVACLTSTLAFALFVGSVFYLIYPFLYWVTPQNAFGRPFGGWLEFHSVADATIMMPLAAVAFTLWFVLQLPLTRMELSLTRALLGPRSGS
jgi:hypothetical protein